MTDVLDEAGRKTAKEIQDAGGIGAYWHVDVGKESDVEKAFAEIQKHFGHIDVLVNNAGVSGSPTNPPTN